MITKSGYAIIDKQGNAIYGVGETVEEAWKMVCEFAGPFFDAYGDDINEEEAYLTQFKTFGATDALINQVKEEGGGIAWYTYSGVACTLDESIYEAHD